MKVGRNQPCPCGSGKKYKHCCAGKRNNLRWTQKLFISVLVLLFASSVLYAMVSWRDQAPRSSNRVWSEEHGHWHTTP